MNPQKQKFVRAGTVTSTKIMTSRKLGANLTHVGSRKEFIINLKSSVESVTLGINVRFHVLFIFFYSCKKYASIYL